MATAREIPEKTFELNMPPGSIKGAAKEAGASSGDLYMCPVPALRILPGFNLRVTGTAAYEEKIEQLAQSMLENGFYRDKPLSVSARKEPAAEGEGSQNVFVITDGHRRYAALLRANERGAAIENVPVVTVRPDMSDADLTIAMMQDGEPKSPYEIALGVQRLLGYGLDEAKIAGRLGITKTYVNDLITLISMPAKIRNLVLDGKVSAGVAVREFRADPKAAFDRIKGGVEAATAKGKKRATPKDIAKASNGAGRKPNPLRTEIEFTASQDDELPLDDIKAVSNIAGGGWWRLHETKEGVAVILQDVKIKGACTLKPALPGSVVNPDTADL